MIPSVYFGLICEVVRVKAVIIPYKVRKVGAQEALRIFFEFFRAVHIVLQGSADHGPGEVLDPARI